MVFQKYANFYDLFYKTKDYNGECDFIEAVLKRYDKGKVKTVLDFGCGTGGHARLLAKRGYGVTGVDFSEKMLDIAKEKMNKEGLPVRLLLADARDFRFRGKFDCVISMFAVMSYQSTNDDVERALKSVRSHLKKGGLFIFDVWFGPAVISTQPSERIMEMEKAGERILRIAKPVLDINRHLVEVNYTVIHIVDDKVKEYMKESHPMRFFFPQEIGYFLKKAGFVAENIFPFMCFKGNPSATDWNISVIARAI